MNVHSTLMAVPIDSLRILPPELRQCIYSCLLFGDGDSTVEIIQRQAGSLAAVALSAVLALPKDPMNVSYRKEPWGTWPDEVDEAFFRGM